MGGSLNIILVGFMGAGKTSTGKELAKIMSYRFLDLDQLVEERCDMKILDIFKTKGEDYFRKMESESIKSLKQKTGYVISTGGGVWLNETNRDQLTKLGSCVWLKVSAEKALKRIKPNMSQRPLLSSAKNPLKIISSLLAEREIEYSKAPYEIDTNDKNPKQTAIKIMEILNEGRPFDLRSMQK